VGRLRDLRDYIVWLLEGGEAHLPFEKVVLRLPSALQGQRPPGHAHSPWEVLEHLRIAQRVTLESCRDPEYVPPPFPAGYWPRSPAPPDRRAWAQSVEAFLEDRKAMVQLVRDPAVELTRPVSPSSDRNLLREALLLADHTAYHLGELVAVRRALGAWPPGRRP
jgi:hypothetical protein